MKITFIFAFALLCGLAFCEERAEFEDETADVADPKRHCKSKAHTVNGIWLYSLYSTLTIYLKPIVPSYRKQQIELQ